MTEEMIELEIEDTEVTLEIASPDRGRDQTAGVVADTDLLSPSKRGEGETRQLETAQVCQQSQLVQTKNMTRFLLMMIFSNTNLKLKNNS